MERLTIPDVRVDEHTTRRAMIDGEAVREHAMDFYWRLKAYEDMGLTPEEIKSMKDEHFSGLEMAKLHSALMELKKYQEADRDGRLVVLPCKVGDTVYRLFVGNPDNPVIATLKINTVTEAVKLIGKMGMHKYIGTFLTREEAEKALEAMKDG